MFDYRSVYIFYALKKFMLARAVANEFKRPLIMMMFKLGKGCKKDEDSLFGYEAANEGNGFM